MTVLYAVLPFLAMLVALIVAHELGHYFTAKAFGVKVLEAGLGYPPRVWGFRWAASCDSSAKRTPPTRKAWRRSPPGNASSFWRRAPS
jgi:Zn-dependent protease